jgi:hypothetical protein
MNQYDEITKLADLKEKGLISEEEFNQGKKKILDQDPAVETKAGTFTFKVIILFTLGLIVPVWPISLPIFWYLAWKSYKTGK